MRSLTEVSGPWVGFWIQSPVRGWMRLHLSFGKGRVSGKGSDQIGGFSIKGRYSDDGKVGFVKLYAWHRVSYSGTWDGHMIFGQWKIGSYDWGEFEIWPEDEFEALNLGELEITEERTLVQAVQSPQPRSLDLQVRVSVPWTSRSEDCELLASVQTFQRLQASPGQECPGHRDPDLEVQATFGPGYAGFGLQ